MLFFIFDNANFKFTLKSTTKRAYTTAYALSTIKQIKIIYKKEFATTVLDKNIKAFVLYVVFFSLYSILIYST